MLDLKLEQDGDTWDIATFEQNEKNLTNLILISLYSDSQVNNEEAQEFENSGYNGWYSDNELGSRLWLVLNKKIAGGQTITAVQQFIEDSLNWLIEENLVTEIDVQISRDEENSERINAKIRIQLPSGENLNLNIEVT